MPPERVRLSSDTLASVVGDDPSGFEARLVDELLAAGDGRFPPGAQTIPAELVSAVQRERLLAAMLRATAQLGYRDLTVQDVLVRAGVSRPTFYEHFENKEDCFLAAFDAAAARLRERLEAAASEGGERWRDRLRMSLEELLRFVAVEPDAARTLIVEARAACPAALTRRDEALDRFAACVDHQVRAELPDTAVVSSLAAIGTVGGIETLLYNRLTREETDDLESLLPSLMYFAVLSYEGPEAADAELVSTPLA